MYKNLIKAFNFLFILIAGFPLIGMRIIVYIIGAWALCAAILSIKEKTYLTFLKDWKLVLLLTSYYVLNLISFLILGENSNKALKLLETKALFFIFPLLICLSRSFFSKKIIKKVLVSFVLANVLLSIYVWLKILDIGFLTLLEEDTYYNPIFRKIFSDSTGIHLPYLGILFAFSCVIIIDGLVVKEIKNRLLKTLSFFSLIMLLLSIMFFSARMAFLAFFIVMGYYFLKKVSRKNAIVFFISLLLVSYLVSFLNPIERRIKEMTEISFTLPKKDSKSHKVNFRLVIYNCSWNLFKDHWLIGTGLGNTQDALNKCYKKIEYSNYDDFSKVAYNTHNQYVNEWLTHGVFGFLIFIIPMLIFIIRSRGLYRFFLLLTFLCLFTENLFQREIGVIFFTLFNTIFYINLESVKKKLISTKKA